MLEFKQTIRVQVIDPDPISRLRLSDYLRAIGLEVQAAMDAVSALAQMRRVTPDVLVLDPAVPRSRRLLAHCPDVPLLLLSAEPNLSQAVELLGAWAALAKPTDLDIVVAVVQRIAGRRAPTLVSTCRGYPPLSRSRRRVSRSDRRPCGPAQRRAERRFNRR